MATKDTSFSYRRYVKVKSYTGHLLVIILLMLSPKIEAQILPAYEQSELTTKASFKQGKEALYQHITQKIQSAFPLSEEEQLRGNQYVITFEIKTDGQITKLTCFPEYAQPIFKVLLEDMYNSPMWNAGEVNGNKVQSTYFMPIHIKYQESSTLSNDTNTP